MPVQVLAMIKLSDNEKELQAGDSEVEKTLASDPNYVPALMARAQIQANKGNGKTAEETYSHILQISPDFPPAQRDLAGLLVEDPQKAQTAYDLASKARKNLPDDPKLALVLARASYEQRNIPGRFSYSNSSREAGNSMRCRYIISECREGGLGRRSGPASAEGSVEGGIRRTAS